MLTTKGRKHEAQVIMMVTLISTMLMVDGD